ncbi:hypothetical protein Tco_1337689 [Tanacetum coccineum]
MSDDKQINPVRKEGGFPEGGKKYPNPPDRTNPDASTIRDQWKYAMRQYSKWYSHAWGTAILAGLSFFALGWVIKGENPIPSFHTNHNKPNPKDEEASAPPHVTPPR